MPTHEHPADFAMWGMTVGELRDKQLVVVAWTIIGIIIVGISVKDLIPQEYPVGTNQISLRYAECLLRQICS